MSAIKAELRNYKGMVTQPYLQIILQVPSEQAQEVIKTLGYPTPGGSIWVGVARLKDEPEKPAYLHDMEESNA